MSSGFIKDSNGIRTPFDMSDIQLVSSCPSTTGYTSLKDILPASPSPTTTVISPTNTCSWQEIPIKNPLVKHAALAYLQPMSTPQESDDEKDLLRRIRRKCCPGPEGRPGGGFGCLEYYKLQAVWETIKRCFTSTPTVSKQEEEDYYYYGGDDGGGEDEFYEEGEE